MGQFDRVDFDGVQITRRQRQALNHVSGFTVERFNLALHSYQGSWRPKTSYSGTSHMGAGVWDGYVYGMSTMRWDDLAEITRLRGIVTIDDAKFEALLSKAGAAEITDLSYDQAESTIKWIREKIQ
jgi:hypothetical protein